MGTILVTGGAGFIGCNFVRLLLARTEERVVVADALTYAGSLASLEEVAAHPRYAFVKVDIADRDRIRWAFQEHRPTAIQLRDVLIAQPNAGPGLLPAPAVPLAAIRNESSPPRVCILRRSLRPRG